MAKSAKGQPEKPKLVRKALAQVSVQCLIPSCQFLQSLLRQQTSQMVWILKFATSIFGQCLYTMSVYRSCQWHLWFVSSSLRFQCIFFFSQWELGTLVTMGCLPSHMWRGYSDPWPPLQQSWAPIWREGLHRWCYGLPSVQQAGLSNWWVVALVVKYCTKLTALRI